MNFKTNDWLKRLRSTAPTPTPSPSPYQGTPAPYSPTTPYRQPPGIPSPQTPFTAQPTQQLPNWGMPNPQTNPLMPTPGMSINPVQQTTGRVGGNQTTAQRTQPMSAQLGGWFGGSSRKQKMQPMDALMSWLSPYLTQELYQQLSGIFGNQKPSQPWTPALPQNITNDLLGRRTRKTRRQ